MRTCGTIVAILLLTICASAQDVSYNFDAQADFYRYKTYRWEQHTNSVQIDDLTKSQLASALNAELGKKGLTETKDADSDLVLVY